jgi:hypothetical protein
MNAQNAVNQKSFGERFIFIVAAFVSIAVGLNSLINPNFTSQVFQKLKGIFMVQRIDAKTGDLGSVSVPSSPPVQSSIASTVSETNESIPVVKTLCVTNVVTLTNYLTNVVYVKKPEQTETLPTYYLCVIHNTSQNTIAIHFDDMEQFSGDDWIPAGASIRLECPNPNLNITFIYSLEYRHYQATRSIEFFSTAVGRHVDQNQWQSATHFEFKVPRHGHLDLFPANIE